jgi:hypothetical protein
MHSTIYLIIRCINTGIHTTLIGDNNIETISIMDTLISKRNTENCAPYKLQSSAHDAGGVEEL